MSSKKITEGAHASALRKVSSKFLKIEISFTMNIFPCSLCARYLPMDVLPVPGGPKRRMPALGSEKLPPPLLSEPSMRDSKGLITWVLRTLRGAFIPGICSRSIRSTLSRGTAP